MGSITGRGAGTPDRRIGPVAALGIGADRSVIAGMGVAAALILAAVGSFMIAGGLLPFNAWPQLSGVSQTRPVTVGGGVIGSRPVARVVVAAPHHAVVVAPVSPNAPAASPHASQPVGPGAPGAPYSANEGTGIVKAPAPMPQHHQNPPPQKTPIEQIQQAVQQTTQQTTSSLASTTEGTTAALGNTVSSVTGGVGNVVSGVSPALGQTVSGLGNTVDATLTGAGRLVGGLLSQHG